MARSLPASLSHPFPGPSTQANEDVTDINAIAAQCAELATAGVTTRLRGRPIGRSARDPTVAVACRPEVFTKTRQLHPEPFCPEDCLILVEHLLAMGMYQGNRTDGDYMIKGLPSQDGKHFLGQLYWIKDVNIYVHGL